MYEPKKDTGLIERIEEALRSTNEAIQRIKGII